MAGGLAHADVTGRWCGGSCFWEGFGGGSFFRQVMVLLLNVLLMVAQDDADGGLTLFNPPLGVFFTLECSTWMDVGGRSGIAHGAADGGLGGGNGGLLALHGKIDLIGKHGRLDWTEVKQQLVGKNDSKDNCLFSSIRGSKFSRQHTRSTAELPTSACGAEFYDEECFSRCDCKNGRTWTEIGGKG
uniref:Secreted protein n=1 Tax=Meloidogyne hapla TaxID=6305 RepID=A0A1I8BPI1_MELHA